MSQIINFTGNELESVSFPAVLDGNTYRCQVKWNLAGERWYLSIKNQSEKHILNIALVGSSESNPINLLRGVFSTSTLYWYRKTRVIEVNP